MADLIPRKESELLKFAKLYRDSVVNDPENFGLTEEDALEIVEAFEEAFEAYREHRLKRVAAQVAKARKDDGVKKLVAVLRQKSRRVKAMEGAKSSKVVSLGLRVRDDILTPAKAPDEPPVVSVGIYTLLTHQIRFWEEGSQRRRRKPKGVIGVEVYYKIGGDRNDRKGFQQTFATASPLTMKFEPEDIGKQVHYYLRWITRRGDRSRPSIIHSATITG